MPILLSGGEPPAKYPVYARSGWEIPQVFPIPLTVAEIRLKAAAQRQWHPRVRVRSISAHNYNCVGLIFAARRAVIEIQHIYRLLSEDGYHQVRSVDVVEGDIVLYKDNDDEPTHVALVVQVLVMGESSAVNVVSKWGKEAEFIHPMHEVPAAYGRPAEFYSERIAE